MEPAEAKCYLCLVALCLSPTQEDADFLRSIGKLLHVPEQQQAYAVTMLTTVSSSASKYRRAEELAAQVRLSLNKDKAMEQYCMIFWLCFQGPAKLSQMPYNAFGKVNNKKRSFSRRDIQIISNDVRFDARTSVILRRLALLLRIKLSAVTALEEAALRSMEQQARSVSQDPEDLPEESVEAKTRNRRKGVIRGLKIGAAATAAGGLLAVTGGLAAPALAAGLTHLGLGTVATVTTTASVAAILGTSGAGLAGYKMQRRTQGVKHFEFQQINQEEGGGEKQGLTVYICVAGYVKRPGPATVKECSKSTEYKSPPRKGQSRRSLFGKKERERNENNSRINRENASDSVEESERKSSIQQAKISAENSPEFYAPWGAQPPYLFPEQVLDRYYAIVAPDRRALVPLLLQKYRKQFKSMQSRVSVLEGYKEETMDLFTSAESSLDEIRSGEERLYSLLERRYGIHPLQLSAPPTGTDDSFLKKEVHMQQLLMLGQERCDAVLAGEAFMDNDIIPSVQPSIVEAFMDLTKPWDHNEPLLTYAKKDKSRDENKSTEEVIEPHYDDILITLEEETTDEDQMQKIIEDLNEKFDKMDEEAAAAEARAKQESSLREEMDRLENTRDSKLSQKIPLKERLKKPKKLKVADGETYWWRESVAQYGDQYTLIWEPSILLEVGCCLENFIKESTAKGALSALQFTALAPIVMTMALPVVIISMVTFLDNYWSMATEAADDAGEILADALMSGAHGDRPVVLIGYSVGGRVVASCLKSLARIANSKEVDASSEAEEEPVLQDMNAQLRKYSRMMTNKKAQKLRASTIVRDAVIIGAPLDTNVRRWTKRRSVVQGRLINVYNPKDWVLALIYRYKSWTVVSLAGMQPVRSEETPDLPAIENYNVSDIVGLHGDYHSKIREILDRVKIGDVDCESAHAHYFASAADEDGNEK